MDRRGPERRIADRGVVSVLSVFFVILLLTFLAVAINLGRLMRSRGDLQHAADSAALAAVGSLDIKAAGGPEPGRTAADFDTGSTTSVQGTAIQFAQTFTMMSSFGQKPIIDPTADLTFGFWHLRPAAEKCAFSSATNCGPGWEPSPVNPPTNLLHMFSVNTVILTAHYPLPPYFGNFLGIGTTTMTARSMAYGRRTRVPCAIPTAVSICQILDPVSGFVCPGGTIHRTFVNNETVDPNALGRVDLINQWRPASQPLMRNYVRKRDFDHCSLDGSDTPPSTEYLPGDGLMPGATDSPPMPRANIQPVIDALAGVETEDGTHQANRCLLGRTLVVPVVQPAGIEVPGDCANLCPPGPNPPTPPPGGCVAWPAMGVQRVVGFVNITFTTLHCWHEAPAGGWAQPPLTADNCETQMDTDPAHLGDHLATTCSGFNTMPWPSQAGMKVEADITCDAPEGPLSPMGGNLPQTMKPRLVR
jgi:hypothetical protein